MKRILCLILVNLILITGCGNKTLNFEDVYNRLEAEYNGYVKVDEDTLEGVYGVSLDEFNSYLVVMDESSTSAKMYAVFEAKGNIDDALYEVKYFIEQYKDSWLNGYFPEQEKLVKDGKMETYGKYIIYVVNEDVNDIIKKIKDI